MDVESEQPANLVVDEEGEIHQWEDDLGASKPTTNRKEMIECCHRQKNVSRQWSWSNISRGTAGTNSNCPGGGSC